jgi:hypothetical protein
MQFHERSEHDMTTLQRFAKRLAAGLALVCALSSAAAAATPILMYALTEASSGTTPTTFGDTSSGTPANLTITYGASGVWTSVGAGNGFFLAGTASALSSSLGTTKVQTAMAGGTAATIQLVVDQNSGTGGDLFTLYSSALNPIIDVTLDSGNQEADVVLNNFHGSYGCGRFALPASGVYVLTVVVDTTLSGTAVVSCWSGTSSLTTRTFTAITASTALDAGESWTAGSGIRASMGNYPVASSAGTEKVYFAALYASALISSDVTADATALAANNDADPNAGVSASSAGMSPWDWGMQ